MKFLQIQFGYYICKSKYLEISHSYFNLYKKLRFNIYYDRSSNLNEYDKSFV